MKRIITLALLLAGFHAALFSQDTIGIHVSGGYSNDTMVSSNIGTLCEARGQNSFAGGQQSIAFGNNSFTFGLNCQATQSNSYAMGYMARANCAKSMSLGFYVYAFQSNSIIIGSGASTHSPLLSAGSGITMGMGSIVPTMYVSAASGNQNTGKVSIGNVIPQAKLHIRSDTDEDAGILLEPSNTFEYSAFIHFIDETHHITVGPRGGMSISAGRNDALEVTSTNFKISDRLIDFGVSGDRRFTFTTQGVPSIGCNAYPVSGGYARNTVGPSYVMEFGSAGFLLRTARYVGLHYNMITNWIDALSVKTDGAITMNGKVGVNIENTTSDYALTVNGGILTTKVHIQDVNDWPDYVFEDDYQPMTTRGLREYIAVYRHLPGVPSEAEVKERGYDVSGMQAVLLEKIEELTLYMLRQQEELDSLRTLVTVSFGYDGCGNRTSRAIAFKGMDDGGGTPRDDDSDSHTSLRDSFSGGEALLFPNPTEGGFVLSLIGGDIPQATAVLCTMEGKVIEERVVTGAAEEFDLSGKPAGVYLLRLTTEGEAKVWKVIKRN